MLQCLESIGLLAKDISNNLYEWGILSQGKAYILAAKELKEKMEKFLTIKNELDGSALADFEAAGRNIEYAEKRVYERLAARH